MTKTIYYHGGKAGMKPGMIVLPPSITGAKSQADYGNHRCSRDRVYVTTEYAGAAMYATGVDGEIYEVEPIGPLQDDPDCVAPGLSYSCERARIVKRHRLTPSEKRLFVAVLEA